MPGFVRIARVLAGAIRDQVCGGPGDVVAILLGRVEVTGQDGRSGEEQGAEDRGAVVRIAGGPGAFGQLLRVVRSKLSEGHQGDATDVAVGVDGQLQEHGLGMRV